MKIDGGAPLARHEAERPGAMALSGAPLRGSLLLGNCVARTLPAGEQMTVDSVGRAEA